MIQAQRIYKPHQDSSVSPFMGSFPCEFPHMAPPTEPLNTYAVPPGATFRNQSQLATPIFLCKKLETVSRLVEDSNSGTTVVPWDDVYEKQPAMESIGIGSRNCGQLLTNRQGRISLPVCLRNYNSESGEESMPMRTVKCVRSRSCNTRKIGAVGEQIEEIAASRDRKWGGVASPITISADSEDPELSIRVGARAEQWRQTRGEKIEFVGVSKNKRSGRYML